MFEGQFSVFEKKDVLGSEKKFFISYFWLKDVMHFLVRVSVVCMLRLDRKNKDVA
jgi:hypothetical protein